jgi:hypothetical protein
LAAVLGQRRAVAEIRDVALHEQRAGGDRLAAELCEIHVPARSLHDARQQLGRGPIDLHAAHDQLGEGVRLHPLGGAQLDVAFGRAQPVLRERCTVARQLQPGATEANQPALRQRGRDLGALRPVHVGEVLADARLAHALHGRARDIG